MLEFLPTTVPGFNTLLQPTSTSSPSIAPKFFQSGFDLFICAFDNNELLIGFYIGSNGTGTHMGFVSKNRVADIVVMRNLYFIKENDIFQFGGVSNDSAFADDGVSADKGTLDESQRLFQ